MTRIGLMGCGMVAGYGHIPAIQAVPELQLHAVYDPDAAAVRRTQERFGIAQGFTEVEPFLASGIAALSITSPAPCHHANVLAAAAHRLPVLCEKPLAMNAAEAAAMIAAMDGAGVTLYQAFCYRFSANALAIRDLVRSGAIGTVRALRLIYNWNLHGKYATDPVTGDRILQARRVGRMLEGGPMVDCGTHQIDLAMLWLGSEVVHFAAHGAWVEDYEAPDHMWLHLDHACGAHTVVEISYSYHQTAKHPRSEFVYELIGNDGVIRYDRDAGSFTVATPAGTQVLPFTPEKDFRAMYAEWATALVTGHSDLLTTAAAGLRVTDLARQATDQAIAARAQLRAR